MQNKFRSNKARNVYNSLYDNGVTTIIDGTLTGTLGNIINSLDSGMSLRLINSPRVVFLLFPNYLTAVGLSYACVKKFTVLRNLLTPTKRIIDLKEYEWVIRGQKDLQNIISDISIYSHSNSSKRLSNPILDILKFRFEPETYTRFKLGDKVLGLFGVEQNQEYYRCTIEEITNYGYLVSYDNYPQDGIFYLSHDNIIEILKLGTKVEASLDNVEVSGHIISYENIDGEEFYNVLNDNSEVHNISLSKIDYAQPILQPRNYQTIGGNFLDIEQVRATIANMEKDMVNVRKDITETLRKHEQNKKIVFDTDTESSMPDLVSDENSLPYYEDYPKLFSSSEEYDSDENVSDENVSDENVSSINSEEFTKKYIENDSDENVSDENDSDENDSDENNFILENHNSNSKSLKVYRRLNKFNRNNKINKSNKFKINLFNNNVKKKVKIELLSSVNFDSDQDKQELNDKDCKKRLLDDEQLSPHKRISRNRYLEELNTKNNYNKVLEDIKNFKWNSFKENPKQIDTNFLNGNLWSSTNDTNWLKGWNDSVPCFVEPLKMNTVENEFCVNNREGIFTGPKLYNPTKVDWNSLKPDSEWGNVFIDNVSNENEVETNSESDGWDHVEKECDMIQLPLN